MRVYEVRIVSMDKMLRFTNTLISIIIIKCHFIYVCICMYVGLFVGVAFKVYIIVIVVFV